MPSTPSSSHAWHQFRRCRSHETSCSLKPAAIPCVTVFLVAVLGLICGGGLSRYYSLAVACSRVHVNHPGPLDSRYDERQSLHTPPLHLGGGGGVVLICCLSHLTIIDNASFRDGARLVRARGVPCQLRIRFTASGVYR